MSGGKSVGAGASEAPGDRAVQAALMRERPRIAIVRLGAIGDVVNTMPLASALRRGFPAACLTWVVEPKALPVLEGHPALDEILVFPRRSLLRDGRSFVRELRGRRFDLVLDTQRLLKSALVAAASGCDLRVGFDRARSKEGNWRFSTLAIPPCERPGVMVEQFLEFASFLGVSPADPVWNLPLDASHRVEARTLVGDGGYVVVNLGASKPPNLWLPDRFGALAERLRAETGRRVVWTGGPQDREMASRAEAHGRPDVDLVGRTSLKVLAAVLEGADLVVACDTGPLHMSVAVGAPVVALFGPADPGRTGPYGAAQRVVLPSDGSRSMHGIQVEAVLEAAHRALAESGAGRGA